MPNLETDKKKAQNIQQVDVSAMKHVKTGNPLFGWTAHDRPLQIPPDNLNQAPSTGMSIKSFVWGMGVGLTHTKNLMMKKLREKRETNRMELDHEDARPTIGRNFKTKFKIPNEYSENILITDSDFIMSDFNTRLEAHFKREYQNVDFPLRQWLRFLLQFHKFLVNICVFC